MQATTKPSFFATLFSVRLPDETELKNTLNQYHNPAKHTACIKAAKLLIQNPTSYTSELVYKATVFIYHNKKEFSAEIVKKSKKLNDSLKQGYESKNASQASQQDDSNEMGISSQTANALDRKKLGIDNQSKVSDDYKTKRICLKVTGLEALRTVFSLNNKAVDDSELINLAKAIVDVSGEPNSYLDEDTPYKEFAMGTTSIKAREACGGYSGTTEIISSVSGKIRIDWHDHDQTFFADELGGYVSLMVGENSTENQVLTIPFTKNLFEKELSEALASQNSPEIGAFENQLKIDIETLEKVENPWTNNDSTVSGLRADLKKLLQEARLSENVSDHFVIDCARKIQRAQVNEYSCSGRAEIEFQSSLVSQYNITIVAESNGYSMIMGSGTVWRDGKANQNPTEMLNLLKSNLTAELGPGNGFVS